MPNDFHAVLFFYSYCLDFCQVSSRLEQGRPEERLKIIVGRRGLTNTRGNSLSRRLRSSSGSILNFPKVGLILLAGVTTHLCRSMAVSTLFFGIGSVQLGVVVIAGGFCG